MKMCRARNLSGRFFMSVLPAILGTLLMTVPAFCASAEGAVDHKAQLWDFMWRLLNFAVLMYILYRLAWKRLVNFFRNRREDIKTSLAETKDRKVEAEERFKEYEVKLTKATDDIQGISEMIKEQGKKIGPDYGILNTDRVHHTKDALPLGSLHLFIEDILARKRERHHFKITKPAKRLAGKSGIDLHLVRFSNRERSRRGVHDFVIPVRNRHILEDIPVVHDISPVAGHLHLYLCSPNRLSTKPHPSEQLRHLIGCQVYAEQL